MATLNTTEDKLTFTEQVYLHGGENINLPNDQAIHSWPSSSSKRVHADVDLYPSDHISWRLLTRRLLQTKHIPCRYPWKLSHIEIVPPEMPLISRVWSRLLSSQPSLRSRIFLSPFRSGKAGWYWINKWSLQSIYRASIKSRLRLKFFLAAWHSRGYAIMADR